MKKCQYCGNAIPDDVYSCPSCGGKQEIIQAPVIQTKKVDPNSSLFEYKRFGLKVRVYPNRISIEGYEKGAHGMTRPQQSEIFVKNISDVVLKGWARKLEITTNDGNTHEILIFGKDAEKVREIVLGLI